MDRYPVTVPTSRLFITRGFFREEVRAWLAEHIEEKDSVWPSGKTGKWIWRRYVNNAKGVVIDFERHEDAVLFKLTWC